MFEEPIVAFENFVDSVSLIGAHVLVDAADFKGVHYAARDLAEDFGRTTKGNASPFQSLTLGQTFLPVADVAIIVGCIESCWMLEEFGQKRKIDYAPIRGKWESFITCLVDDPMEGCRKALVIAGSDKRGAIYGAYTLSKQIGISPWHWWADVPAKYHTEIHALPIKTVHGEPSIQYRGIFINDEAPALTGWVLETFGSYNSDFYKKVFELLLRLRANFMWPAMWPGYPNPGAVFFMDDAENQRLADEYGICVSTSHHEPMQRATTEWFEGKQRPDGSWDWTKNRQEIIEFFRTGVERARGLESYFNLGIRGEYDKRMRTDDPGAVIRDVLQQQRVLFKEVHGREDAVPQVLALYKEIQDLYRAGEFTVPDDVTLLFADDNFGSLRTLPSGEEVTRPGGAGIYYHFQYVGAPRSYKWINSNSLGKIHHQLSEAHRYNARKIWVFNVGDIKPIELPLTFAMEMAWDINSIKTDGIPQFLQAVATDYFGPELSADIVHTWIEYDRLIRLRKHEHIEPEDFSLLNYNEAENVVDRWCSLVSTAVEVHRRCPEEQKAAIWELVVHPVKATKTYVQLRVSQAKNQLYARQRRNSANRLLRDALDLFDVDFQLSQEFHSLLDGKWNNIMCQSHLGYGDTWHAPFRDAIFGLAYVQRQQNSNLIVGQMGVAVEGHEGVRAGRINEESERTHPSRRDLVPGLTLGPMTRYGPGERWFDIFTRGTQVIRWAASASSEWARLSLSEGTLLPDGSDDRVKIQIDWDQVPQDFEEEVIIIVKSKEGDFEQVHLPVRGHRVSDSFRGFVEGDGYVSVPAPGLGVKQPYIHHPELGRGSEGAVTAVVEECDDIAFLEYPVYLFSHTDSSTLSLYFNMTLDLDPVNKMTYEINVDDKHIETHDLITPSGDEKERLPAEGWLKAVMDCVWKKDHNIGSLRPGAHIIRVRFRHSNIILEKIVLNVGGVKDSYLGPPVSYCTNF